MIFGLKYPELILMGLIVLALFAISRLGQASKQ